MFKIVCAGWRCFDSMMWTLNSIDLQSRRDFEVMISYESENEEETFSVDYRLKWWIKAASDRDTQFRYTIRTGQENFIYGTKARYEAIQAMEPDDEDVIIWLNLDGDRFAHHQVLDRVHDAYADGFPLLTYGNYENVPPVGSPLRALPYDNKVIVDRSFRSAPYRAADLRTMKFEVFNAIPLDQFQWSEDVLGNGAEKYPHKKGEWYKKVDDVTSMIPALEMVGYRHRYIEEVLMVYNSLNPFSAWRMNNNENKECDDNFRAKPPLKKKF